MTAAIVVLVVVLFLLVLFLISAIKVAREYERGIIFRLGRLLPEPKGPGLFLLIPIVDRMVKAGLRTIALNVPPQEGITKDNVPVRVNAVAYFRAVEPTAPIVHGGNLRAGTAPDDERLPRSERPAQPVTGEEERGRRLSRPCRSSGRTRSRGSGRSSPREGRGGPARRCGPTPASRPKTSCSRARSARGARRRRRPRPSRSAPAAARPTRRAGPCGWCRTSIPPSPSTRS